MNGVPPEATHAGTFQSRSFRELDAGDSHVFITCREWRKIDFKSQGESLRRGFRGKGSAAR